MTPHAKALQALADCGATPDGQDPYSLAYHIIKVATSPAMTLVEVKEEYGVSLGTAYRWRDDHGWKPVGKRWKAGSGRHPPEYARAEIVASLGWVGDS